MVNPLKIGVSSLKYSIKYDPSYSMLVVDLAAGAKKG